MPTIFCQMLSVCIYCCLMVFVTIHYYQLNGAHLISSSSQIPLVDCVLSSKKIILLDGVHLIPSSSKIPFHSNQSLTISSNLRCFMLASLFQERFNFSEKETVELYVNKILNRGLCAMSLGESLLYKFPEVLTLEDFIMKPSRHLSSLVVY